MSHTQSTAPPQAKQTNSNNRSRTTAVAVATVLVLVAVITVVGVTLAVHGHGSTAGSDAADVQRVRELDQSQRQALVAGDADKLAQTLAPDFELVPPPGDEESRAEYLNSISSGDLVFQHFKPISPVKVRISGTMAVVTYESRMEVTFKGQHVEHEAWHTHVYEKDHDQWRQVWAHTTAIGSFPPPGS